MNVERKFITSEKMTLRIMKRTIAFAVVYSMLGTQVLTSLAAGNGSTAPDGSSVATSSNAASSSDKPDTDSGNTTVLSGTITFMDHGTAHLFEPELKLYVNGRPDGAKVYISRTEVAYATGSDADEIPIFNDLGNEEDLMEEAGDGAAVWTYRTEELPEMDENGIPYRYSIRDVSTGTATSSNARETWALYYTDEGDRLLGEEGEWTEDAANLIYVGRGTVKGSYRSEIKTDSMADSNIRLEISAANEDDMAYMGAAEGWLHTGAGTWTISDVLLYNPETGLPIVWRAQVEPERGHQADSFIYENTGEQEADKNYIYAGGTIVNSGSTFAAEGIITWEDGGNWHGIRPTDLSFIKVQDESGNDVTNQMVVELYSKEENNWLYRIDGLKSGENYLLSQSLSGYQAAEAAISAAADSRNVQLKNISEQLMTRVFTGTIFWVSGQAAADQPEDLDFLEIYEGSNNITEHISFSLKKNEQDTSVWHYTVEGLPAEKEYELRVTTPAGYRSNFTEYALPRAEMNAKTDDEILPAIQFSRSEPLQITITNDTQGLEAGTSIALSYKIMVEDSEYTGDYILLDENGEEIPGSQSSGPVILVGSGATVKVQLLNAQPGIEIDVVQSSLPSGLIALAKEQNGAEFTFRNSVLTEVEACIIWNDNNNYNDARPYQNEQSYLAAGHLELYFSLDGGTTYRSANVYYEELGMEERPEFQVLNSAGESSDWHFIADGLPSHVYVDGEWTEVQYQVNVADSVEEPGYIISEPEYITDGKEGSWNIFYTSEVIFEVQVQWFDDNDKNQVRPGMDQWKETLTIWQIGKDGSPVPVDVSVYNPDITVEEHQGDSSQWDLTISGLPEYDENGYPYTYYVVQGEITPGEDNELLNQVEDLSYGSEYDNTGNFATNTDGCCPGGTIINSIQGTLTFSMTKEWTDGNTDPADRPDTTLTLWRYVKGENYLAAVPVELAAGLNIDKTQSPYVIEITDDLPLFDGDGHEYIYFIKEDMDDAGDYSKDVGNQSPFNLEDGANWLVFNEGILNNKLSTETQISGNKTWKAKSVQSMKAEVTFELQRREAGSSDDWSTVEEKTVDGFRAEVTSQDFTFAVDKYDDDGILYEYRIVETGVSISYQGEPSETVVFPESSYEEEPYRYQVGEYEFERITEEDGTIVNKLVGETAIEIDKFWDPYDPEIQELHFHVFRNGEDACICKELSEELGIPLADDGNGGHLGILVLTPDDYVSEEGTVQHWNKILEGLPKYDDEGAMYLYTVTEDVPQGYSHYQDMSYDSSENADYSHLIAKVFNGHGDGARILVTKTWLDDSDLLHREEVTVELFKNGVSTGEKITLSAESGWWGYFGLAGETSGSVDYSQYSVKEIAIGGSSERQTSDNGSDYFSAEHHVYEVEEVTNEDGTVWKIINRRVAEISIDLTKTWVAGGEEADYNAVFEVLQNGNVMDPAQTVTLTADSEGNFHGKIEDLPKYDEKGGIIHYTLREIEANGSVVTSNTFTYGGITYQTSLELNEVAWGDEHEVDDTYYWKAANKRVGTSNIAFHKIWKDLDNEKTLRPDIYLKLYRWIDNNADGMLDEDEKNSVECIEQLAEWKWDNNGYHQIITYEGLPDYNDSGNRYGYYAEEVVAAPNYHGIWQKVYFDKLPDASGNYQGDYSSLIPLDENNEETYMPENGIVVNYRTNEDLISGKKIWENMGVLNKEDYPDVTILLYASYLDPLTGNYGDPQPVTDENGAPMTAAIGMKDGSYVSTYKFENLPKYDEVTGARIIYTVSEDMEVDIDNFHISNMDYGFKNTYKEDQNLSLEINKDWNFGSLDLPDSALGYPVVVFDLYRVIQKWDGSQYVDAEYLPVRVATETLDRNDGETSVSFEDLAYYAPNGRPYRYYVRERVGSGSNSIPGYDTEYGDIVLSEPDSDGKVTGTYEVINTYTEEKVDVKGSKTWKGDTGWVTENGDTFRPEDIELELWRKTASMPAEEQLSDAIFTWENKDTDTWEFTFEPGATEFYRYATNGEEYVYTVKEVVKPDTGNGYSFRVSAKKSMEDGTWTYTFTAVNTLQTTELKVSKKWDDSDNLYGTRPPAVTVKLQRKLESEADSAYVDVLKNGSAWVEDLTAAGGWAISFSGLPRYRITWVDDTAVLEKYVYRVVEVNIPEDYYAPDAGDNPYQGDAVNGDNFGYVVTNDGSNWVVSFYNVLKADDIEITAQKVWEDDGDEFFREKVTFGLFRDGGSEPIATVTLDGVIDTDAGEGSGANGKEDTAWHVTWKNQPKWIGGDPEKGASTYEVKELNEGFFYEKGEVTGSVEDGFVITNKRAQLIVKKVWFDQNDYYNTRPEKLKLIFNPELPPEAELSGPRTNLEDNTWYYVVKNLPEGVEYSVSEEVLGNYEASYATDGNGVTTITNELRLVDYKGTKRWDDEGNYFGIRPESVELLFYANGKRMDPQPKPENIEWTKIGNVWSWKVEGLLARDAEGKDIVYTVKEEVPDNYEASYETVDGETMITNKLRLVDYEGTKRWNDDGNYFGIRPETIELLFYANGKRMDPQPKPENIKWTKNGDVWSWKVEGLLARDAEGEDIVYTVEERPVSGYDTSQAGVDITNTLRTGVLAVTKIQEGGSAKDFTFRVKLNINGAEILYTGSYTVLGSEAAWNDPGEVRQTDESGAIVIQKDQQFVITDLPADTPYIVTEDATSQYTLISSTGNTGEIPYQTAVYASFTNKYTSTDGGDSSGGDSSGGGGSGGSSGGSSSGGSSGSTGSPQTGTDPTTEGTVLPDDEEAQITSVGDDDIPLDGLAKLGDNSLPYALLITIMLGAIGAISVMVLKRRKEENE